MKKVILSVLLVVVTTGAFANDKGNGGSGDESSLAGRQAVLESTALKIKNFFSVNGTILQREFPEFKVQDLVGKIDRSDIRVVDVEELKDKHGKSRSCLNYPDSNLIECKYSEIEKLESNPQALFVLTMHEYLGLLGVEETSPRDSFVIEGYSISKRLAGYVTKVNDYNLILTPNADCSVRIILNEKNIKGDAAKAYEIAKAGMISKGFKISSKSTATLQLKVLTRGEELGMDLGDRLGAGSYAEVVLTNKDFSINEKRSSIKSKIIIFNVIPSGLEKASQERLKDAVNQLPTCSEV
jgi:hypothetical protein